MDTPQPFTTPDFTTAQPAASEVAPAAASSFGPICGPSHLFRPLRTSRRMGNC